MTERELAYELGRKHGICEMQQKLDGMLAGIELTNTAHTVTIKLVRQLADTIASNRIGSTADPIKLERDRIIDELNNDAVLSITLTTSQLERIVEIVEG